MNKKSDTSENNKAINYEPLLYPVFNDVRCDFDADDWDEEEDEDIETDGYECMNCGNIQDKHTGFGCDRCAGPLRDWYS